MLNKIMLVFFNNPILTKTIKNKKGRIFAFGLKTVFIAFVSIAFFSFPGIVSGQITNSTAALSQYTYTLNNAAMTSAGVFATDSTLIRTLWTTVYRQAGTYNLTWDGKDDSGKQMPAGNYIIEVLSNNVQYTWDGIIGNTSDANTGSTVHRGMYYFMTGMTIVNGTAYYCSGYSEGSPAIHKFLLSKPQEKINVIPNPGTTANTDIAVNDGQKVYWAGYDPFAINNTWVAANNISDDSDVIFSNGTSFSGKFTRKYSAISLMNQANSAITGMAVQKTGNFLFVARGGLNQLSVLNKTTGQLIQTISINNPQALCTDMNDNLWMVSNGNNVSKYTVNASGTLSSPLLTISSVGLPVALAVSPNNATIAIADGAVTSQQIKAFNNLTGSSTWTLGTPGGYMQDATVTNNKFYFNDIRGAMYKNHPGFLMFIAFQPDGSFWVNDPGNYRVQHYSAQQTFIETIMALGTNYSDWADKNDNTRVGAEYLEFKLDNTQPLSGNTGWQLVRNWGANIPSNYNQTAKFTNVITLTSAGVSHTYGFLRSSNIYYPYDLVEFMSNGTLRFTGVSKVHCNIEKDGALLTDNLIKYNFTGFDAKNNPVWSNTPILLADISKVQDRGPIPNGVFNDAYVTSSGKVIFYAYGIQQTNVPITIDTSYHLGAMRVGGNSYLWKTAKATHQNYMGPFPDASRFDIGNHVNNYAGNSAMILNRNIVTGYHGEFWRNSETNKYNHYLDNGLAINQFGITGPETSGEAPAFYAGNVLTPQLVSGSTSDEMYLYTGDESQHAGMHRWKIDGLNTIAELDIPITYPSAQMAPLTVPGNNLMVNLPYDSPLLNNTAGWTFNPATTSSTGWSIKTNCLVSGVKNDPDIYIKCMATSGTFSLNRDLGNNSGLVFWTVSGEISYYWAQQTGGMQQFFDILDNNGKIIARISNVFTYVSNALGANTNTIYGNNKVLVSGLNSTLIQPLKWKLQPVAISAVNNLVTIQYAGYSVTAPIFDPTADITSPKTMRAYFIGGYNATGRDFDFKDMRFNTTKLNQSINFSPIPAQAYGNPPFALIANSSSNLPITFTLVSGPALISGNTIVLTGTGNVIIQASQSGNTFYNAANPVTQSFTVTGQNISRIDH